MSEAGLLDFAGLDAAATSAEAITPEVDVVTDLDAPEVGAEETQVETKDGAEKGAEEGAEKGAEKKADPTKEGTEVKETDSTPQNVRKALKAMRDADPANAKIAKELHNSYERAAAFQKEFPSVQEARDAKAFIDSVGGHEGWEAAQATIANIEETDALLYAGDKKLVDNVVADLKETGNLAALGKIGPAFIDAMKSNMEAKAFSSVIQPHVIATLEGVNLHGAITALGSTVAKLFGEDGKTVNADALKTLKEIASDMDAWWKGEKKQQAAAAAPPKDDVNPEREKFNKEKADWEAGKKKEFNENVGKDCEKYNNKALGGHLKGYLNTAFFKEFPRETLIDLGNGIKERLYKTLEGDSIYQKQMKSMWSTKTPDAAKIKEYHNAKLDAIAEKIVRDTIQARYPNYAKGGKAAGRVAAAETRKVAENKVAEKSVASGQPVYVAQKPKWEAIDWAKDPKQLLYIAGKAFLKPVGKTPGKFVTWRKA
jgi:hypothetical protein